MPPLRRRQRGWGGGVQSPLPGGGGPGVQPARVISGASPHGGCVLPPTPGPVYEVRQIRRRPSHWNVLGHGGCGRSVRQQSFESFSGWDTCAYQTGAGSAPRKPWRTDCRRRAFVFRFGGAHPACEGVGPGSLGILGGSSCESSNLDRGSEADGKDPKGPPVKS